MSEQYRNTSLDWDRCVICQVETDERLTHPDSGYKYFSMHLKQFEELGKLPVSLTLVSSN